MKTTTFETRTASLMAGEEQNPTMNTTRSTDMEALKFVRSGSGVEMAGLKTSLVPDGPELWRLYSQNIGAHTENTLVECYLPLVHSILNRLSGTLPEQVDRDDLCSAGVLGLLDALRKFNPAVGVPFISYARQRIRGAMLDEMRRLDWVPRIIHAKSRELQRIVGKLEGQLGRAATRPEKAKAMNMTVAQFDDLLAELRPVQFLRLDAVNEANQEDENFPGWEIENPDQIDPMEQVSLLELGRVILERLKQMPGIQRQVLMLYFIEGMSLCEISEDLGVTNGRVCQIKTQAISSLRNYLKRYESGLANPDEPTLPMRRNVNKQFIRTRDDSGQVDFKTGPASCEGAA